MQSLELREDDSIAAHRFLALSRLLMYYDPPSGAGAIAHRYGEYEPYRPGWNVDQEGEGYVWIGAREEEGRRTTERPEGVPDSKIYRPAPEPPFLRSRAHNLLNRSVSVLAMQLSDEKRRVEAFQIHSNILQIAEFGQPKLQDWTLQIAESMDSAVSEEIKNAGSAIDNLTGPANQLITDYLTMSVPGIVARGALLKHLHFLLYLFPLPPSARGKGVSLVGHRISRIVSLVKHLRNRTAWLLIERENYDLASFYQMTFLASLLGGVALMFGRMLLDQDCIHGELLAQFRRMQRMLDEEVTYSVGPTYLYPALYCDSIIPGELRVIRGVPVATEFAFPQLYRSKLSSDEPAQVFRELAERTAGLPRYDLVGSLGNVCTSL
jgi:hypothetical protein